MSGNREAQCVPMLFELSWKAVSCVVLKENISVALISCESAQFLSI